MMKTKLLASAFLMLAVLFAQVGTAAAAPQTQTGTVTVTGTITAIGTPQTDTNGVTMIPVTIKDANGVETTILVSETDAAGLTVGQENVTLTGNTGSTPEEDVHPISALLGDFFGVDPAMVDSWHTGDNEADQVFGFGVIAQALWMSGNMNGGTADATLAGQILQAKKTGNYDQITLPDGFTWPNDTAPTNWGQFKKLVQDKHQNLGAAVSSEKSNKPDKNAEDKGSHGKGQGQDKGQGKGHNKP